MDFSPDPRINPKAKLSHGSSGWKAFQPVRFHRGFFSLSFTSPGCCPLFPSLLVFPFPTPISQPTLPSLWRLMGGFAPVSGAFPGWKNTADPTKWVLPSPKSQPASFSEEGRSAPGTAGLWIRASLGSCCPNTPLSPCASCSTSKTLQSGLGTMLMAAAATPECLASIW